MNREPAVIDLDAAFTVLVEECGASESGREMFLAMADEVRREAPVEYRFQGALGFGGKFRMSHGIGGRLFMYVDCYPEDEMPERREMIARANRRLARLEPLDLDRVRAWAMHQEHSAGQCEEGDELILRLAADLDAARAENKRQAGIIRDGFRSNDEQRARADRAEAQRDENLANVRRIDDLRIADTARLQRELDAAEEVIEAAEAVRMSAGSLLSMSALSTALVAHKQAKAGEGA